MRIFKNGFLQLVTLLIIISSCGDDDDDDNADPILGTWNLTTFSLTNCENNGPDLLDFACGNCISNEFKSDGNFTSRIFIPAQLDSMITGTYSINGSNLTTCDQDGNNCENSTFMITDNMLAITTPFLGCESIQNFDRN